MEMKENYVLSIYSTVQLELATLFYCPCLTVDSRDEVPEVAALVGGRPWT